MTENEPQNRVVVRGRNNLASWVNAVDAKLPDARLVAYIKGLPRYYSVLDCLREASIEDSRSRRVLQAHVYLGIKLCDADRWLQGIRRAVRDLGPKEGIQEVSSQADAFLFAIYGALDALSNEIVAAHGFEAKEEVKFPAMGRLLSAHCEHASRCQGLRRLITQTLEADWFIDLRRIRNLVNFRSVVAAGVASDRSAPYQIGESDQNLGGVARVIDFCSSVSERVVSTVEEALRLMDDGELLPAGEGER